MIEYKARWQPGDLIKRGLGIQFDESAMVDDPWFARRQVSETLRSYRELQKEMGIGRRADRLPSPKLVGANEEGPDYYYDDHGDDGDVPGTH